MKARMPIFLSWLLLLLAACDGGRRQQMEALLDRADSLNRAYIPMTGGLDSLLSEAASYYDRHGSPNEQLRAHYLLGCAYRDMGDAPQALQCYQDAVDRADTLASDCDYHRLMAVYGQMAELFDAQNLSKEELEIMAKYQRCALNKKDTLKYIRNMELMIKPYFLLGDTDKVLSILNNVHHYYIKYGYEHEAAASNATAIFFYVQQGQLDKARMLMNEFEQKSGLFDEKGNISAGREYYYNTKGRLFLKEDRIAEAEQMFRKLLPYKDSVVALEGLMQVYIEKKNIDSIVVFARRYENAINNYQNSLQTEVVQKMSSMYNYQRYQRKADAEAITAANAKAQRNGFVALLVFTLALLFIVGRQYQYLRRRRAEELVAFKKNYENLQKTRTELSLLQQHEHEYQELIAQKKAEIAALESTLGKKHPAEVLLKEAEVYKRFHSMANKGKTPSSADWEKLNAFLHDMLPAFCQFLTIHEHELNNTEFHTCVLTRIHIKPKAISTMLGVSASYITKVRRDMHFRLFKEEGSASDFDERIVNIC